MAELPSGWTPIGAMTFWRLLWTRGGPFAAREAIFLGIIAFGVVQFGVTGESGPETGVSVAIGFVVAVLALLVVVAIAAERSPAPYVNFDTDELRVKRRIVAFREIDEAKAWSINWEGVPDRFLRFGKAGGATASVRVRSNDLPVISEFERQLVAEVLRRSNVRLPELEFDRYDPTGRFARTKRPNHLTRDEAVEYVLNTPVDGEPLHGPRPESI